MTLLEQISEAMSNAENEWWNGPREPDKPLCDVLAVAAIKSMGSMLRQMLNDPPSTLDEPDTDAEVLAKIRRMFREALNTTLGES